MSSVAPSSMANALYQREWLPWTLAGCALGLVEGAAAAVLVKQGFQGLVTPDMVNMAVAFVSGSPALANMTSFMWANLAHGRDKVRWLVMLLACFGAVVTLIGLTPRASAGLAVTVLSVLVARMIWSGVLTVRAAVWTANYPRAVLATITGRIVVFTSLGMAASALLAATILETRAAYASVLYVTAGVLAMLAAWRYRRVRVRQSFRLRQAEVAEAANAEVFSLAMLREILRSDPQYRRYMTWMGLYGAGNLMITGQLVILLSDHMQVPAAQQVGILTIVPLLCIPIFTPRWAKLFDAGHVIDYRAKQCWALVAAMAMAIAAVFSGQVALLWVTALMLGISTAGANLGWNLGHTDFASLGKVQHYMGVNVTLTGMRGLIAPPVGMVLYTLLERHTPGAGRYSLLLPFGMTLAGAIGFNLMKHERTGIKAL